MASHVETSAAGDFVNLDVTGRARHPDRRVERSPTGRPQTVHEASPAERDRTLPGALAVAVAGEVRFDDGSRALYATDSSNYRQVPIGVVVPRTVEDVVAAMRVCREHQAPFLSRGGGTSLCGQCCNVAVVVDHSKYLNRILSLDPERRTAWVEPGCVLDDLRDAAERHHLTFGPDPSTHDHNTLGGMIGNNSCGVHSVYAGRTADNVRSLDILTYDGLRLLVGPTSEAELRSIVASGGRRAEIYRRLDALRKKYGDLIRARYPKIPRRVSGYNLDALLPENGFNVARALLGSEGTLVAVLAAELDLVPSPPERVMVVLGYPDVFQAGDAVPEVLPHKPLGCEGMDEMLIDFMRLKHLHEKDIGVLPEGQGWLMVEFGGETKAEATEKAQALVDALARGKNPPHAKILREDAQQAKLTRVRTAGLGATAFVPRHPEGWEGWEDTAVPPDRVGAYLRDLKALFKRYGYDSVLYGHFGDGCIHCRIDFGLRTEDGIAHWRRFLQEGAELVARYGGSISGEHGDGQSKAELLDVMFGSEVIEAFREFKSIWDPAGKMNPGKVVDPFPITSNLRLGPGYVPPKPATHFAYKDDHGSFAHATLRCVGVGKCRHHSHDGSVMCPSYMVTREEKYSTRGRAHLLFEMLHGGAVEDGWRSEAVEEALDLCLACKGCKSDCPVNVDMATYKAEFRSHHYAGRLRPRAAYTMGLIHRWSRLASRAPALVNFATHAPGLSTLVKRAAGIAPERSIPAYAPETFRAWFARHRPANPNGPRVLLWPDTFNDHFRVPTAIAATRVLEAAGFRVTIPRRRLCCGRPLYDWGRLDAAKAALRAIMDSLRDEIEDGVPLVGLEPACLAVFRDELVGLFPDDRLAKKLSQQSLLFSEFLDRHARDFRLPRVNGGAKALVQIHCHHHAVLEPDAERRVLARLGLDHEVMPSGCCGMADSFGFEADKHDVSMRAAERVLLPKVRQAAPGTLVLADGFSCREQIEQGTGRRTLHLAELIAGALGPSPAVEGCAERSPAAALLALAAGIGVGAAIAQARRAG